MKKLEKLLIKINQHNLKIFKNTKPTEKLDFSKTKKNWGTKVIPKKYWINKNDKYQTISGKEVIIDNIKLFNEIKKEYTFPIKGRIRTKHLNKRDTWENTIWTLDGRNNLGLNDNPSNNLIKII